MNARTLPADQPTDGAKAWLYLVLSVLISSIGTVGIWSVVVVLPAVQAEYQVDRATASIPYTLTMTGFALGNVIVGRFLDRVGVRLPLLLTAVFLGVGFIACAMSREMWLFALIHGLLIGVGSSTCFGPLMANISHWFKKRRGIAVAITACGTYIAGTVWPMAMKGMLVSEGWRFTYFCIGLFCVVTIIPLALAFRHKPPIDNESEQDTSFTSMNRNGGFVNPQTLQLFLMIAGVACCVAMSMPQVHIIPYTMDLGFAMERGAEMLSLMLAGGVISRIMFGFVADKLGGLRTCLIASTLQCLALLLFLPFDGLGPLYFVSFLFGLSQGGIVPSYTIIVRDHLPANEAGQRVGLVVMATIFGMALGGLLSGWIYDLTGSYEIAFLNGIAWNLLNIMIIGGLLWRSRPTSRLAHA